MAMKKLFNGCRETAYRGLVCVLPPIKSISAVTDLYPVGRQHKTGVIVSALKDYWVAMPYGDAARRGIYMTKHATRQAAMEHSAALLAQQHH